MKKSLLTLLTLAVLLLVGCANNPSNTGRSDGNGDKDNDKKTYTITFDANGGTVSPTSGVTGTDGKLASLPTPEWNGYIFEGWYTAEIGGERVATSTVFGANTVIYAQWNAFIDSRDSKIYRKVTIGSQTWMAENLNYDILLGYYIARDTCYDGSQDSCIKYGRLYDWATAMRGASSSDRVPSGVQGACPAGWHLPSDNEWQTLIDYVGGQETAGKKLKSTTGWNENGNGTDEYGFSALPSGSHDDIGFGDIGDFGSWWSATELKSNGGSTAFAYDRSMKYDRESIRRDGTVKTLLFSVRCVQN